MYDPFMKITLDFQVLLVLNAPEIKCYRSSFYALKLAA